MAESVTIARPYAEAVFRLGRETGALDVWSERLKRLSMIAQDKEMAEMFGSPRLSSAQLSQLVLSVCGESDEVLSNFVSVLAENERLALLPEISELFEAAKAAGEGIKEAEIASAFPLDDAQVAALLPTLETHFKSRLSARVVVEPELIGGVRVAVGDQVLDTSVRGKLEAMATALKN